MGEREGWDGRQAGWVMVALVGLWGRCKPWRLELDDGLAWSGGQ